MALDFVGESGRRVRAGQVLCRADEVPAADEISRGHIVLISSTSGQRGEAFHTDYSATKGALISMTKGLSTELAPEGIYVNCVAPGWVDTDMSAEALADPRTGDKIRSTNPLGRVRQAGRDCRTRAVPVYRTCRLHHRRNLQCQWRRGPGGLEWPKLRKSRKAQAEKRPSRLAFRSFLHPSKQRTVFRRGRKVHEKRYNSDCLR